MYWHKESCHRRINGNYEDFREASERSFWKIIDNCRRYWKVLEGFVMLTHDGRVLEEQTTPVIYKGPRPLGVETMFYQ